MNKHPFASKTIWGAIITVVGILLERYGVKLTGAEAAELAGAGAALGGIVLTVIGRFKASGPLSVKGTPTPGIVLALVAALAVSACAVQKAETPAQKAYAIETEYNNVQRAIIAYGLSEHRDDEIIGHLKRLNRIAVDAIDAMRTAAAQGDPVLTVSAIAAAQAALREVTYYMNLKGIANGTASSSNTKWNGRRFVGDPPIGGGRTFGGGGQGRLLHAA